MARIVPARVTFRTAAEGGRSTPAMSGVRPHLKLGDIFTTSVVHSATGNSVFEPGQSYEVTLEIVFWDQYGHLFRGDAPVELYDGNRLIASGVFLGEPRDD